LNILFVYIFLSAAIDEYSSLTINILPSDNSLGIFQFPQNDLQLTTQEGGALNIPVVRNGGALDSVVLTWLIRNASNEFNMVLGSVKFGRNEFEKVISIQVINDQVRVSAWILFCLVSITEDHNYYT